VLRVYGIFTVSVVSFGEKQVEGEEKKVLTTKEKKIVLLGKKGLGFFKKKKVGRKELDGGQEGRKGEKNRRGFCYKDCKGEKRKTDRVEGERL
jgi:hypothetical protein